MSRGSTKYGKRGGYSVDLLSDLDMPDSVKENLVRLGNLSLSQKTWSSYKTAERMLLKCQKDRKIKIELPISSRDTMIFIDWLVTDRALSAATVNSYLSGIRQLHLTRGMEPPATIRTKFIDQILKGKANEDAVNKRLRPGPERLPVTENVMLLLKEKIRTWNRPLTQKLLIWTVCTFSFAGAFRTSELLCRTESSFDPDFDLLTDDISMSTEKTKEGLRIISVTLKCPKENKANKKTVIDIFESKGHLCPVKAFTRWADTVKPEPGYPLFRDQNGTPLTGNKFNKTLRELLADNVDYEKGKITTHSFRSGVVSMMAQKGYSDEEMKAVGRWSSRAFELYAKLPRRKRAKIARKIEKL